jgi:hypothetical protein
MEGRVEMTSAPVAGLELREDPDVAVARLLKVVEHVEQLRAEHGA